MQISLNFVPICLTDNKSALINVMAWHWPGDKPLPIMAQFTDTNKQLPALKS